MARKGVKVNAHRYLGAVVVARCVQHDARFARNVIY